MNNNKVLLIAGLTIVGVGAVANSASASEHGTFVDNSDYKTRTRTEITGGKYSEHLEVDSVTVDNWDYRVGSYSQKIYLDGHLNSPTGIEVNGRIGTTAIVDPRTEPGQPVPPTAPPVGDPIVNAREYTQHFSESMIVGRNWGHEVETVWFSSEVKDADYESITTFSETGHRSESGKYIR